MAGFGHDHDKANLPGTTADWEILVTPTTYRQARRRRR